MASEAIAAKGTLLQLGDGSTPEAFTTIAEVGDIDLPDFGNEKEDVTVHTTPGRGRAYITTTRKDQTVGATVNLVPDDETHDVTTGLWALAESGERANFRFVLPDDAATTWEFSASVETFQPHAPVQGVLTADLELAIDGVAELVEGS